MTMIRILKYSLIIGTWLFSSFGRAQDLDHSTTPTDSPAAYGDGDVRIVGGHLASEGRVEVNYNGEWGTVCDTEWYNNLESADVVCRSLGFDGALEAVTLAGFGRGSGPIVLDGVRCLGSESSILDCPHSGSIARRCDHFKDAGVRCKIITDQEIVLRLLSGSTSYEGVVEYRIGLQPGLICDPDWSEAEANVTCRQLGYQYGLNEKPVSLGPLSGTIFNRDYRCDGTEQQIGDCVYSVEPGGDQCNPDHIAQVSCGPPRDYDLRMTGSNYSEQGRLEVFLDGEWGYMQSDSFWTDEHDTVCRQLGYAGGNQRIDGADYQNAFARSSRPILIDDLYCSEDSMKITECQRLRLRSHESVDIDRSSLEQITVICYPHNSVANHPIRLLDENGVTNQDYGVIEIYHDGKWGPICDTRISFINYEIVCEQLGHTNLTSAGKLSNLNGRYTSSLPVWFPEIMCNTRISTYEIDHRRLYECLHEPWGTPSDCTSDDHHFFSKPVLAAATCVPMSQVNPTGTVAIDKVGDGLTTSNYTGSGPEMRSNLGAWKVILMVVTVMITIKGS